MRAVTKGSAPKTYKVYGDAKFDLANRIGWFCSYCEMGVSNMIEVEHVVPINNGGAELDWNNFLLSCRYCNGIKSDNNISRVGYIWPDKDNTHLCISYEINTGFLIAKPTTFQAETNALINLVGLNRNPNNPEQKPSEADTRWIFRLQALIMAKQSLLNWKAAPSEEMANQIAFTAQGIGFYSIWKTIFSEIKEVSSAIDTVFPGTYASVEKREGGII